MIIRGREANKSAAFTLIEVVLAISISVVILVVAIYFYHQTSNFRTQLIQETERLATIRLLLQKMTTDFRAIDGSGSYSFIGTSNSVSFVIAENRLMGRWSAPAAQAGTWPVGLFQVVYQVNQAQEGANVVATGLVRDERAVDAAPVTAAVVEPFTNSVTDTTATLEQPQTNSLDSATNILQQPITQLIEALAFEYWDGTQWTNVWQDFTPPSGIRISLSAAPFTENSSAPAGVDTFRRTVFLPSGGIKASRTNSIVARAAGVL
jgi:type II secretory pathway pseudopilin PulG